MNIKNNKRGGYYWIDGKPYISVTKVIDILNKPQLMYWYGKQVYLAMVKNPTLSEKEAMSAPYQASDKAKSRGSTVHSVIEFYVHKQKYIDSVPEEFKPYATAFYQWVKDNKVTIVGHEKTLVSKKHNYAGTCDMIAKLNGNDELIVVDIKTSKGGAIYKESELQVSAYVNALKEEGMDISRGMVVALSDTGKYATKEADDEFETFLACKKIYEWINKDELKTIRKE